MVTPRKDFFWLVKCEYFLGVIKGLEIKMRSSESQSTVTLVKGS